jgi:hypothetical protein
VEALCTSSFEGTINVGDVGEIVASLLLMFTFDDTHYKSCGTELTPRKFRLGDFISSLFETSLANNLAACADTNESMSNLFSNGVVFFNHFVRLTKDPTEHTLEDAFVRGAALFAPFKFPGCDIIIPVFMPASTIYYTFIQYR